MEILFFIGISIFILYTIYVILKTGILSSFSESYYALKKDGWLFQLNMIITTFTMLPTMLIITEKYWWQFISFFAIAPITFVGVAPKFKTNKSLEKEVHIKAAKISAIGSLIWVILGSIYISNLLWIVIPTSIILMIILWLLNHRKNYIWWAEYACFMWTLTSIGILLFQ